jgi:hypothetical protein
MAGASSVPKLKGTKPGKESEPEEENPTGRKVKTEKKEENFLTNPANKIHWKKIPF